MTSAPTRGNRQSGDEPVTTNLPATVGHYRNTLGFDCLGTWGPPVYAIVARDALAIHFRVAEPPASNPCKDVDELLDAYVFVRDADALHAEYAGRGAGVHTSPWRYTLWGSREFVLKDCDGRLLAFGSDLPSTAVTPAIVVARCLQISAADSRQPGRAPGVTRWRAGAAGRRGRAECGRGRRSGRFPSRR